MPADVADHRAIDEAADHAAEVWGGIDVWVNNAMTTVYSPIEAMTAEEFRRVTDVTYLGQVHGTLAALRHMRKSDRGTIVQVGSALTGGWQIATQKPQPNAGLFFAFALRRGLPRPSSTVQPHTKHDSE